MSLAATIPENSIRFSSVLTSNPVSTPVITLASGVHQLSSLSPALCSLTPSTPAPYPPPGPPLPVLLTCRGYLHLSEFQVGLTPGVST